MKLKNRKYALEKWNGVLPTVSGSNTISVINLK